MIAYADTGFLISLYSQDSNSAAASAVVKQQPVFLLTFLGEAEFTNAIELQVFRKQWTRREARLVRQEFLRHQGAGIFRSEPLGPEFWERAFSISRRHTARLGTRTIDLLHVAAALVLNADALCSFDERQRIIATAERLRVLPG